MDSFVTLVVKVDNASVYRGGEKDEIAIDLSRCLYFEGEERHTGKQLIWPLIDDTRGKKKC